jgi:hypothetical protein
MTFVMKTKFHLHLFTSLFNFRNCSWQRCHHLQAQTGPAPQRRKTIAAHLRFSKQRQSINDYKIPTQSIQNNGKEEITE